MINHFDLFGLRQVWFYFLGKKYEPLRFRIPFFYKYVRHPLYLGWLIAFWATPVMSAAHLLFAALTTGYIFTAIKFEEKDLITHFGDKYSNYKRLVPTEKVKVIDHKRAPQYNQPAGNKEHGQHGLSYRLFYSPDNPSDRLPLPTQQEKAKT